MSTRGLTNQTNRDRTERRGAGRKPAIATPHQDNPRVLGDPQLEEKARPEPVVFDVSAHTRRSDKSSSSLSAVKKEEEGALKAPALVFSPKSVTSDGNEKKHTLPKKRDQTKVTPQQKKRHAYCRRAGAAKHGGRKTSEPLSVLSTASNEHQKKAPTDATSPSQEPTPPQSITPQTKRRSQYLQEGSLRTPVRKTLLGSHKPTSALAVSLVNSSTKTKKTKKRAKMGMAPVPLQDAVRQAIAHAREHCPDDATASSSSSSSVDLSHVKDTFFTENHSDARPKKDSSPQEELASDVGADDDDADDAEMRHIFDTAVAVKPCNSMHLDVSSPLQVRIMTDPVAWLLHQQEFELEFQQRTRDMSEPRSMAMESSSDEEEELPKAFFKPVSHQK